MSDPITDLKQELLAAADRQHGRAAVLDGRRRFRPHLGRSRLVFVAPALAVVIAVVALFVSTPWSNSPSFLARAEAALTPDAGTVVHMKWKVTSTSTDPACTVTNGPSEIWIDQAPPHTYRALLKDFTPDPANADPRMLACARGTAHELGGAFDTHQTLMFVSPNALIRSPSEFDFFPLDPVTELREAISGGRAHDEGKTKRDGRTVEQIRIDPPPACHEPSCFRVSTYAYVDPASFYPVETDCNCGVIALPGRPAVRLRMVTRYMTFEYLPRTAANLALTDIHAQHPHATGPN